MIMASTYDYQILHEVVSDEDLFEGKPHQNIADSIYRLITSSETGTTIGLEGGWGVGKSTVIHLLEKKLTEDKKKKTLFFVFDAWAHDGDPLRRIFLESLIDSIDNNRSDSELQKLKKSISGRSKKVDVITKKSPTAYGRILGFFTLLVPAGAAVLSSINYDTVYWPWNMPDGSIHWQLILGGAMALAPLLFILTIKFLRILNINIEENILEAKTDEEHTQNITQEDERTSIEFEVFFKDILEHVFIKTKKYDNAVLVIDNLDRVEPKQTLALWSILQTFFQYRRDTGFTKCLWSSKLWFLIPYDRDGLSRVWDGSIDHENKISPVSTLENPDEEVSLSFMNKCFQVIAEVPEPVMSSWAKFLEDNVKVSLTGWSQQEQEQIIDTFVRVENKLHDSPTPRQIKVFINRVGMLGLRWGGEMHPESIALYAWSKTKYSDKKLRSLLCNGGIPGNYKQYDDSFALKPQLSGMLLGVEENKGMELLLEPDIRTSLTKGKVEKLKEIIQTHKEAFWMVWNSLHLKVLPTNDHAEDYKIVVTNTFCEAVKDDNKKAKISIDILVDTWISTSDKWDLANNNYAEALSSLIENLSDPSEFLNWLKTVFEKYLVYSVSNYRDEKYKAESLSSLFQVADLLNDFNCVINKKTLKGTGDDWIEWLKILESQEVETDLVLPSKEVIGSLSELIHVTSPDKEIVDKIIKTHALNDTPEQWAPVVNKLTNWAITQNRRTNENECVFNLMLRLYVSGKDNQKEKIKAVFTQNEFLAFISDDATTSPSLAALSAVIHSDKLLSSNMNESIKEFWKEKYEEGRVKSVLRLLFDFNLSSLIWQLAIDKENKVANGALLDPEYIDLYSSPSGPLCFDRLSIDDSTTMNTMVLNLEKYGAIENSKDKLLDDPVAYKRCLEAFVEHGSEISKSIVKSALSRLKRGDWEEQLKEDFILFNCIVHRGDHEFTEGFLMLATKELNRGELTNHIWDNINNIYFKVLDADDVRKRLATVYFNSPHDGFSKDQFKAFSETLRDNIEYITADEIQAKLEQWFDNNLWDRINWLTQQNVRFNIEPKEALISRINTAYQEHHNEHSEKIKLLAAILNINLAELSHEEADDSTTQDNV